MSEKQICRKESNFVRTEDKQVANVYVEGEWLALNYMENGMDLLRDFGKWR